MSEFEVVRLIAEVLGIVMVLGTLVFKVVNSLSKLHGKVDNMAADVRRINGGQSRNTERLNAHDVRLAIMEAKQSDLR